MNIKPILTLLNLSKPRPTIKWGPHPTAAGWYLSYERGRGFQELFWPGEDEDTFNIELRSEAHYLGPFQLPL